MSRPLEPQPAPHLAREFMIKTRRRKVRDSGRGGGAVGVSRALEEVVGGRGAHAKCSPSGYLCFIEYP